MGHRTTKITYKVTHVFCWKLKIMPEGPICRLVYDTCITSTHKYTTQISVITNWLAPLFNTFWFDYRFSGSYRKHVMVVPVLPGKRCDNALKVLTTASFNIILTSTFISNVPFNTLLLTALYIYIYIYIYIDIYI